MHNFLPNHSPGCTLSNTKPTSTASGNIHGFASSSINISGVGTCLYSFSRAEENEPENLVPPPKADLHAFTDCVQENLGLDDPTKIEDCKLSTGIGHDPQMFNEQSSPHPIIKTSFFITRILWSGQGLVHGCGSVLPQSNTQKQLVSMVQDREF